MIMSDFIPLCTINKTSRFVRMRGERVGGLGACPNVSAEVVNTSTRAITDQCFHLITGLLACAQTYGCEFQSQAMCREKYWKSGGIRTIGWALGHNCSPASTVRKKNKSGRVACPRSSNPSSSGGKPPFLTCSMLAGQRHSGIGKFSEHALFEMHLLGGEAGGVGVVGHEHDGFLQLVV